MAHRHPEANHHDLYWQALKTDAPSTISLCLTLVVEVFATSSQDITNYCSRNGLGRSLVRALIHLLINRGVRALRPNVSLYVQLMYGYHGSQN